MSTGSYPAQPSPHNLLYATEQVAYMSKEAKTKKMNLPSSGWESPLSTCPLTAPRLRDWLGNLQKIYTSSSWYPVRQGRHTITPQDVTQTATSHAGSSPSGPSPTTSQSSFAQKPCFQLRVTVGAGSQFAKTQTLPIQGPGIGQCPGRLLLRCSLGLVWGGPDCESPHESAGPSLFLFTSWEHFTWKAGLGRSLCLREAARLLGDCFRLGSFPRNAETAFK